MKGMRKGNKKNIKEQLWFVNKEKITKSGSWTWDNRWIYEKQEMEEVVVI